ncbi:MAG TPA: MbnP family protein [Chthoniobacterales bacterium]
MIRQAVAAANLTLVVHHVYDGAPLKFDTPVATNAGEKISISRLAYLVSEPSLKDNHDWLTTHHWVAFVDATKGSATRALDQLPPAKYNALRFSVGLLPEVDASDPASYPAGHALNPNVNGLHWGWAGGFVFLALEGHHGAAAEGFSYHIAGAQNRMEVTLPIALDLTTDTTVELDFHVDQLFAQTTRIADQNSTHSRGGDAMPPQITTAVECAFTIRSIHATEAIASAAATTSDSVGTPFTLKIPRGIPVPDLPADFRLTNERVALGQALFHETRLSRDNTQSCASCHDPQHAFADTKRFSIGVEGALGSRNAMSLFNLGWKHEFFWDGRAPSIRTQVIEPITRAEEMHASLDEVVAKISADETYRGLFAAAFGAADITADRIGIALESFVLTLTSFDSRFDRAMRGEAKLSETEKRGFQLFVTEYDPRQQQFGADCFHCHGGPLFTDNQFHNNGMPPLGHNSGRVRVTRRDSDRWKFATPSLRNVALTAPYMHDGRFASLEDVIEHYDHGVVRSETLDPNLAKHPPTGLGLSTGDKAALVAFLKTLTTEP